MVTKTKYNNEEKQLQQCLQLLFAFYKFEYKGKKN